MKFSALMLSTIFSLSCFATSEWSTVPESVRSKLTIALREAKGTTDFNNTTWQLTQTFCAKSLNPADIANPNRVYDLSGYYQTWHFDGSGNQVFEIHNAAKDKGPCATKITGAFGYAELPDPGAINAVMATTTTKRERASCPSTYTGPSLGLIHLISWVAPGTEYRDSTLAGSINTTVCPNTTDYLITNWKKYDTL